MGVDFDIDSLIRPYEEGGTKDVPIKRTLRTITNALLVRYSFPPDIAGAAIWKVLNEMVVRGLEFKGDGSYGSKGAEFFSCIKAQAAEMLGKKSEDIVKEEMLKMTGCVISDCPRRSREMKIRSKWDKFVLFLLKPRMLWRV